MKRLLLLPIFWVIALTAMRDEKADLVRATIALKVHSIKAPSSLFDSKGYLKEASVESFLNQADREGKLSHTEFKSGSIRVQDMVTERSEAPWGTTQLFAIESSGKKYIFKGIAKADKPERKGEVAQLLKAAGHKDLEPLFYPNKETLLASAYFPYCIFFVHRGRKKASIDTYATSTRRIINVLFKNVCSQ